MDVAGRLAMWGDVWGEVRRSERARAARAGKILLALVSLKRPPHPAQLEQAITYYRGCCARIDEMHMAREIDLDWAFDDNDDDDPED